MPTRWRCGLGTAEEGLQSFCEVPRPGPILRVPRCRLPFTVSLCARACRAECACSSLHSHPAPPPPPRHCPRHREQKEKARTFGAALPRAGAAARAGECLPSMHYAQVSSFPETHGGTQEAEIGGPKVSRSSWTTSGVQEQPGEHKMPPPMTKMSLIRERSLILTKLQPLATGLLVVYIKNTRCVVN